MNLGSPPPFSFFSNEGSSSILQHSLEIVHRASSTTLLFFFLFFSSHPPLMQTLISLPSFPCLLSLSFIQFNFELCTCRRAKRVAPWLPGTRPSHYTANWFWPAAMSAAPPHPPPHLPRLCTPNCLQQSRFQNTQDGGKQLPISTSNFVCLHAPLYKPHICGYIYFLLLRYFILVQ